MSNPDFDRILDAIGRQRHPPVDRWNPEVCGEIDIRIDRNGTWYYRGSPITRKRLVKLFASVMVRDGNRHFLVTPVEKLEIRVEDAPFIAVEMEADGEGRKQKLAFRTNVDDWLVAGGEHEISLHERDGTMVPCIHVRRGLVALIARPVYYRLAEMAVPDPDYPGRLGIWSDGRFFPLGKDAD